jgi:hypothetical protein
MTRCANRNTSTISPVSHLAAIAANDSPTISVGSPIDPSSAACSVARRDDSRRRAFMKCAITCPVMPMASDRWSPAAVHKSRSSSKPVSAPLPPTRQALPQSRVRGAMRIAARSGSSSGSLSATSRALRQLTCAAAMSRKVDQVPARMCQP